MTSEYGKAARNVSSPPGRSGPYDRQPRQPMEEELEHQMYETPANSVKVSATTEVRELANTIGQAVALQLEVPALLTIGHQSINQAIKGIAAAASDLKATVDLTFQPAFRHENRTKPLIAFYLAHQRIANRIDAGSLPQVRELKRTHVIALGPEAVTNAVLAIGNARLFLEKDSTDIKPAFRHENRTKPLIAFYLAHQRIANRIDVGEEVELTATKNQKIVSLAGAIAGKASSSLPQVRELKRTHVIALGPEAVTNAVLAIGNARLFLEKDSTDIKVTPEFVKVNRQSGEMNAIRFNILPERI
ncbi:uncharacterized protein HaLaN_27325 [Haematococcus lacustris]|uniref:Uncharacterized protein n=1 Tax=Haematococcus lacustris TaxID=44745 RepID=A0A6A0A898_HAELA|nr:uncharacterized protein HaLaN_27325 [Haematococcus lacustris]